MKMNYKIAHDQVWTNQTFVFENYLSFTRRRSWLRDCGSFSSICPWQVAHTATLATLLACCHGYNQDWQCWSCQASTLTPILQSSPIPVSDSLQDGFFRFANPTLKILDEISEIMQQKDEMFSIAQNTSRETLKKFYLVKILRLSFP